MTYWREPTDATIDVEIGERTDYYPPVVNPLWFTTIRSRCSRLRYVVWASQSLADLEFLSVCLLLHHARAVAEEWQDYLKIRVCASLESIPRGSEPAMVAYLEYKGMTAGSRIYADDYQRFVDAEKRSGVMRANRERIAVITLYKQLADTKPLAPMPDIPDADDVAPAVVDYLETDKQEDQ